MDARATPDECFDPIGYGAYKEVYALSDNYVIKFVSECNNTEEEMRLLNAAVEYDVDPLFPETYFIPLTGYHPALYLLEVDTCTNWTFDEEKNTYVERDPDYEPNRERADYVIIQRRVTSVLEDMTFHCVYNYDCERHRSEYIQLFSTRAEDDFRPVPTSLVRQIGVTAVEWHEGILTHFGFDFYTRFAAFCDDNNVRDLHNGNVGFLDGIPCIVDWLSDTQTC